MKKMLIGILVLSSCGVVANADVFTFSFQGMGTDMNTWSQSFAGPVSGRIELNGNQAVHVWIDQLPTVLGTLPNDDVMTWSSVIKNSLRSRMVN